MKLKTCSMDPEQEVKLTKQLVVFQREISGTCNDKFDVVVEYKNKMHIVTSINNVIFEKILIYVFVDFQKG